MTRSDADEGLGGVGWEERHVVFSVGVAELVVAAGVACIE
jgi:hypothetical protein